MGDGNGSIPSQPSAQQYSDFLICSRIIYLCRITSQLASQQQRKILADLEGSLLQFAVTFKSQILGDPRVVLIGSQAIPSLPPNLNDELDDTYAQMENDTIKSYNQLANIMENQDMQSIVNIFAEKMIWNLVYSDGKMEQGKQIIDITLDTFDVLVSSPSCCRILCKSPIVIQLIQNHVVSSLSIVTIIDAIQHLAE